jgi:transposase
MRQIREIIRLKHEQCLSHRAIARICGVGAGTVSEYLRRAGEAGLGWPLPADCDDDLLEARLFPPPPDAEIPRPRPDFVHVHQELRRKGVTLQLLWIEYRDVYPQGFGYSRFCELYRRWARKLAPSMRQVHRAGEKVFVDFAGHRPHLVDPATGEIIPVELFVGVLGAGSLTYAEAVTRQDLGSWIRVHVHMFEFFGGCPAALVPDQLKAAVTGPCRYEPVVNRTYAEMAAHYGAVVIPARPAKPRDKAKAEAGVLVAERWILAALRNRTFFSLAELNQAIRERLEWLNGRPMRRLGKSRRELFEAIDRPALRPLPPNPYELAEWNTSRVNIDYHIQIDRNYYSVPFVLLHEAVEVRFTTSTIEVFHRSRRVTSHARQRGRGRASTRPEHMPPSHRAHAEWSPSRFIRWAEKIGPATAGLITRILHRRRFPEQSYRSCLGILRLAKGHGNERLEAACGRAAQLGSDSYRTIHNILATGVDRLPFDEPVTARPIPKHDNVRGADFYDKENPC